METRTSPRRIPCPPAGGLRERREGWNHTGRDREGRLRDLGLDIDEVLKDNDEYNALKAGDSLIVTGPTGTNVNDLTLTLIRETP